MKDVMCSIRWLFRKSVSFRLRVNQNNGPIITSFFHRFSEDAKMKKYFLEGKRQFLKDLPNLKYVSL